MVTEKFENEISCGIASRIWFIVIKMFVQTFMSNYIVHVLQNYVQQNLYVQQNFDVQPFYAC